MTTDFNWRERGYTYASPEYYRLWREVNNEHSREYHRQYDKQMYKDKYEREAARRLRYVEKYPIRAHANMLLNRAVRKGKVIKQNCGVCSSVRTVAHHPDYSRPLEVLWLCELHHKEWHRLNKVVG